MFKILGLMAAVLIGLSTAATAQSVDVNCAALSGSPMMCVKNTSPYPVIAIRAASSAGINQASWINIPGGPIQPGGTSIVKFPTRSGGCMQFVEIRTADSKTRVYQDVDVCQFTSFTIRW